MFSIDMEGHCRFTKPQKQVLVILITGLMIVGLLLALHLRFHVDSFFDVVLIALFTAFVLCFCIFVGVVGLGWGVCVMAHVMEWNEIPTAPLLD